MNARRKDNQSGGELPGHVYKLIRETLASNENTQKSLGRLEEGQKALNDHCASLEARQLAHEKDCETAHGQGARAALWKTIGEVLKIIAAFGGGALLVEWLKRR